MLVDDLIKSDVSTSCFSKSVSSIACASLHFPSSITLMQCSLYSYSAMNMFFFSLLHLFTKNKIVSSLQFLIYLYLLLVEAQSFVLRMMVCSFASQICRFSDDL